MARTAPFLAVLLLAGAGGLAMAAGALGQGSGSGTDNPDLLRGSVGVGCTPGTLCHFPPFDPSAVALAPSYPLSMPSSVQPAAVPPAASGDRVAPATITPLRATAPIYIPDEGLPRPFDAEYALTLRGAYVRSDGRDRFELLAIPQVNIARSAAATDFALAAQAGFVAPSQGDARLSEASLDASALHRLSPSAGLSFDASLDFSRDDANGLTIAEADVAQAPDRIGARFDAAYAQRFGQFDVVASAGLSRQWVGETRFTDGSTASNAGEEVFAYGGGMRLGYQVTPIVGAFVSGAVEREDFIAPDADLGVARSGTLYELRTGLTGTWSDRVTLEASIGSAWRDYDSSAIADSQGWLYGVSVAYAPTTTTEFSAALDTRLDAGRGTAGASEIYDLTLAARYRVNPWLALRASALAGWDVPVDGSAATERYGAGAGADFVLGPRTIADIDYSYGWRNDADADPAVRDEHRISAGLTLRY